MKEKMLTIPAAAKLLRVNQSYVRRLAAYGTLPAVKLGRDWLLSPAGVEALALRRDARMATLPLSDTTERGE